MNYVFDGFVLRLVSQKASLTQIMLRLECLKSLKTNSELHRSFFAPPHASTPNTESQACQIPKRVHFDSDETRMLKLIRAHAGRLTTCIVTLPAARTGLERVNNPKSTFVFFFVFGGRMPRLALDLFS